jgi:hypothetical protein
MGSWYGWIFDTGRQCWQRVCEADDLGACSRRLGEIAQERRVKDRYAVMTGGSEPPFRPVRRRSPLPANPALAVEMLRAEVEVLKARLAEEDRS